MANNITPKLKTRLAPDGINYPYTHEDLIFGDNQSAPKIARDLLLENGKLFLIKNGVKIGEGITLPIYTIPTKVSQLTNDSGFLTSIPSEYVTDTELTQKGYATEKYADDINNSLNKLSRYDELSMQSESSNIINNLGYTVSPILLPSTVIGAGSIKVGGVGAVNIRYFNIPTSDFNYGSDKVLIKIHNKGRRINMILNVLDGRVSSFIGTLPNLICLPYEENSEAFKISTKGNAKYNSDGTGFESNGTGYTTLYITLIKDFATQENIDILDSATISVYQMTPKYDNLLPIGEGPSSDLIIKDEPSLVTGIFVTTCSGLKMLSTDEQPETVSLGSGKKILCVSSATFSDLEFYYVTIINASDGIVNASFTFDAATNTTTKVYVQKCAFEGNVIQKPYTEGTAGQVLICNGDDTVSWKDQPSDYLSKNNNIEYTPTADYNPATKKYVDDSKPTKVSQLTNDSGFITASDVDIPTDYGDISAVYPTGLPALPEGLDKWILVKVNGDYRIFNINTTYVDNFYLYYPTSDHTNSKLYYLNYNWDIVQYKLNAGSWSNLGVFLGITITNDAFEYVLGNVSVIDKRQAEPFPTYGPKVPGTTVNVSQLMGDAPSVAAYVGKEGQLVVDKEAKQLHLMDGITPGGFLVGSKEWEELWVENIVLAEGVTQIRKVTDLDLTKYSEVFVYAEISKSDLEDATTFTGINFGGMSFCYFSLANVSTTAGQNTCQMLYPKAPIPYSTGFKHSASLAYNTPSMYGIISYNGTIVNDIITLGINKAYKGTINLKMYGR